ncbi:hypothetical protein LSAT2_009003 [Lamellibrachia satsuma]|nr:hypothetical protein LSAT2_009003 [Lamellibrachia satsuma]
MELITDKRGFDPQSRGEILLFDFKKPRHGAHALDIVGDLDRSTFSPFGLSIWSDCNSNVIYIFVVNVCVGGQDTVEKFRYDEKRRQLCNVRTFSDPTITQSVFLEIQVCRLLRFYDGRRGHILLTGISSPNSVNTSPDGKYVYMSEIGGRRLSVYIRELDNSLTLKQLVPLGMPVGNIYVDLVSGHLWVTRFPDDQASLKHSVPPHTAIAPSEVLRLTLSENSQVTDIVQVYYNDGRQISMASSVVHYRRYMLFGSVFTKLLFCEVNHA